MIKSKTKSEHLQRAGFSLVELLVAITIMVILATIVGINFGHAPDKAREAKVISQLETFKVALQMYAGDNGSVPTQRQGLDALCVATTQEPVPRSFPEHGYLESRELPLDPWNNAYVYLVPGTAGERYEIISYGRDGAEGGDGPDADLSSAHIK